MRPDVIFDGRVVTYLLDGPVEAAQLVAALTETAEHVQRAIDTGTVDGIRITEWVQHDDVGTTPDGMVLTRRPGTRSFGLFWPL